MNLMDEVGKILNKILNLDVSNIVEIPPDENFGDYSLPCFTLAKQLKKNPEQIAKELSQKIKHEFFEKVEVKGSYINLFLNKKKISELALNEILKSKEKFGSQNQKKKILIEFPSPNTNKPLHLGHVRNIAIGQSISFILEFLGNKVAQVNLNNDRGIHICKSMLAYKKFGKNKNPDKKYDHFVGDFYVLYNKNENEDMKREIQEMLKKWEDKDKETILLWKKMNKWALEGFNETYKNFNLKFKKTYNENKFYDKGKAIILDGLKKGLFFRDDQGAIVVDLERYNLGKEVLLRPDGTSIYITQDVYLAKLKNEDFKPDLSIYVVGSEQNYHFKVLFKVLEILGFEFAKKLYHLSYGMIYLPEGKMKSREGTVVDADDMIQELEKLAREEISQRYKLNKKELEKRSYIIALSALRFHMLKVDPARDIVFNPKESISFLGETGPYIQYTYARISSIFRKFEKELKGKIKSSKIDVNAFDENEFKIIKRLSQFPEIVDLAASNFKPSMICHYLIKLCQEFNNYYVNVPILKGDLEKRDLRLLMCKTVQTVIKVGLSLLNIGTLEEM